MPPTRSLLVLRDPWALSRPVLRTAGGPRRPLAAVSRDLHADVDRLCPPPRRRQPAGARPPPPPTGERSELIEAAGWTSDQSGVEPVWPLEKSCSSDEFSAVGCQVRRVAQVEVSAAHRSRHQVEAAEASQWRFGLLVASSERTYSGRL